MYTCTYICVCIYIYIHYKTVIIIQYTVIQYSSRRASAPGAARGASPPRRRCGRARRPPGPGFGESSYVCVYIYIYIYTYICIYIYRERDR